MPVLDTSTAIVAGPCLRRLRWSLLSKVMSKRLVYFAGLRDDWWAPTLARLLENYDISF